MFKITKESINGLKLDLGPEVNSIGGIVTFDGTVRNHNNDLPVMSLEYEAYSEMAEKIGARIVQDALEKFDIVSASAVHRVGHLQITDSAVIVTAGSHHRKEAFEACQYIIDTKKKEVPIWKREHYVNQSPKWVACHRCAHA